MSKLKLTQYLYNEEEVKLSFIYSILTKQDITEVYYWLFELYYSYEEWRTGDADQLDDSIYQKQPSHQNTVFHLIWQLYYDYYYLLNPKFESYIRKKQTLWEISKRENQNNKSVECRSIEDPIFYIIKNMHMMEHNADLFIIRQIYSYTHLCQTHIVKFKRKGRPPSYLKTYDIQYHDLFYWILKKRWINICYYLKRLLNGENMDISDVYKNITRFCIDQIATKDLKEKESKEICKQTLYNVYIKTWQESKYSDLNHFILKTIYHFMNENINIVDNCHKTSSKNIYVCPLKEDIELTIKHMTLLDDIPTNKEGEILTYKILSYKRSYPLYDEIGSFNLERFNMNHSDYKKLHYYNWEYYALKSPIWKRRILKYNGKFCNETKKIIFGNDSDLENFYELYGYDFDEQSLQIQDLSLLEIKKLPSINWIYSLYGDDYDLENQDKEDILNVFKEIQELVI